MVIANRQTELRAGGVLQGVDKLLAPYLVNSQNDLAPGPPPPSIPSARMGRAFWRHVFGAPDAPGDSFSRFGESKRPRRFWQPADDGHESHRASKPIPTGLLSRLF